MLFGGKIEIPTIEKDIIELEIPEKTQNLTNFRIKGKGMPNLTNNMVRGDLVAVVLTKIPTDRNFLPEFSAILKHHSV
jgi:molecular chaperone DnaJ